MKNSVKFLLIFLGIAFFPVLLVMFILDNLVCALIDKSLLKTPMF